MLPACCWTKEAAEGKVSGKSKYEESLWDHHIRLRVVIIGAVLIVGNTTAA